MGMSHFHAWALGLFSVLFVICLIQGNILGALAELGLGIGQVLFMVAAIQREKEKR